MQAPRLWTTEIADLGKCKETKAFLASLGEGWIGRPAGSGHVMLQYQPTGVRVVVSGTPGDRRSLRNARAQTERAMKGRAE